jgi:hypothetical protein
MFTFADYLRPLLALLPPVLISPAALADLTAVGELMPEALDYYNAVLEFWLNDPRPAADMQGCAAVDRQGQAALAGLAAPGSPAALLFAHPAWRRIGAFCRAWADPASPLSRHVDHIWFDFDLLTGRPAIPVPFVLFGLVPLGLRVPPEACTEESRATALAVAEAGVALLQGAPLAPAVRGALARCFHALPPGAQIAFAAVPLARPTTDIRLIVKGLAFDAFAGYLREIGWPGDPARVGPAVDAAARFSDATWLDLDVGAGIAPKFGMEYHLYEGEPALEPRWGAFFDFLEDQGLCSPEKRDAVLGILGTSDRETLGDLWPQSLRLAEPLLGPLAYRTHVRALHSAKLVYHPDGSYTAKVYVSSYFR